MPVRMAAIYARVSSEQQREERTIASQTAALVDFATTLEVEVPKAWIFEDDGYSGATLERPGLERVRDLLTMLECASAAGGTTVFERAARPGAGFRHRRTGLIRRDRHRKRLT